MKIFRQTTCSTLLLLSILFLPVYGQSGSEATPPYKLSEIKIRSYDQTTDSLRDDVRNDKDDLWNELDLSLLVTVEISGKAGSYSSNRKVEVIAYEGNRVILKRVVGLGVLSESGGKYYVPVWLYGPFCRQVTIKARLIGQRQTSALQRRVNFGCGE
jgi:hypothetical protein